MNAKPLHTKDTEAYCKSCGTLVLVYCRNVLRNEKFHPSQVYEDKGQAPFKKWQKLVCKNCNLDLVEGCLVFRKPGSVWER